MIKQRFTVVAVRGAAVLTTYFQFVRLIQWFSAQELGPSKGSQDRYEPFFCEIMDNSTCLDLEQLFK